MGTYVPGIISLQLIQDGMRHLVSTVPLRTGTAVDIHHFDFFHGEAFYSLFGGRGLDL